MLNLRLDVVRADDLLVLSFEFVNLDFDVDETPVLPRLVRFSLTRTHLSSLISRLSTLRSDSFQGGPTEP